MLSEIININAKIRSIELDNYDLLISAIENTDLIIIFHVKYQTAVILDRFQRVVDDFSKTMSEKYSMDSIKIIINNIFGV